MGICRLCEKERELCESHIIPKFIFDWIKKTSATGYLRLAININQRLQDGTKEKILCKDCELKFSKYENYFAKEFFYPYINRTKSSFEHDARLQKFIISVSWRLLKKDLEGFKDFQPEMFEYAKRAEKYWREILLEDKTDEKYEHHLFLFDYISDAPENLPDKFQDYMMRSTDGTLASSSKEVYVFSKFPSIFFVSSIYPTNIREYWNKTLVLAKGKIGIPQTSAHPGFSDFLFSRVEVMTSQKLTQKQNDKIKDTMLKNLDRVRKSKSFEVWEEEQKRKFNL